MRAKDGIRYEPVLPVGPMPSGNIVTPPIFRHIQTLRITEYLAHAYNREKSGLHARGDAMHPLATSEEFLTAMDKFTERVAASIRNAPEWKREWGRIRWLKNAEKEYAKYLKASERTVQVPRL
jgi:hypothetical protein